MHALQMDQARSIATGLTECKWQGRGPARGLLHRNTPVDIGRIGRVGGQVLCCHIGQIRAEVTGFSIDPTGALTLLRADDSVAVTARRD